MKNNDSSSYSSSDKVSKRALKAISPYRRKQDVSKLFATARAKAKINKDDILASEVDEWDSARYQSHYSRS